MLDQAISRWWAKVDRRGDDECWPWKGSRTASGYGQLNTGITRHNKYVRQLATHIALAIGGKAKPSPSHVAMHLCDNPLCVNPQHLKWGTMSENSRDMISKGRGPWQVRKAREMDEAAATLQLLPRNAKLTIEQVRHIRSSEKTPVALAKELGVSRECIVDVLTGKTWRQVS
jgi:hypothetical protein